MEAATVAPAQVPLHHLLRARTAAAHARLDAGLDGGFRDAREYAAYLAGMAAFVDAALAVIGEEDWLAGARDALARDLGRPVPPPAPRDAAVDRGDEPRRAGWRYVAAGSCLGARVLLRDARRLHAGLAHGTSFLATFSGGDAWPRCLALLRDADFDAGARERACDAALEAFHAAEAALNRAKSESNAA